MKLVLVGEVKSADYALLGMLRAGCPPELIVTTDLSVARVRSRMGPEYYGDLSGLAAQIGASLVVVADLSEAVSLLTDVGPDYIFVVGWPYLVRSPILALAPCIGMHPTRLPYRRGGAPLNWAILDGEQESAVTLFQLTTGIDDGPILCQRTFRIDPQDYVSDALEKVYTLTEELVAEAVRALASGTATWTPQDHAKATYTRRRTPEDGKIDWRTSASRIRNLVRAVSRPFPGAFSHLEGRKLVIWRAELPFGYRAPIRVRPGSVVEVTDHGILVSTKDNALLVTEAVWADDPTVNLTGRGLAEAFKGMEGAVFDSCHEE